MTMSRLKQDDQKVLLDQLSNLGFGQSETEDSSRFRFNLYPIAHHLRAFYPDVVLVVGDRGTGKSALFNAVFKNKLLPELGPFSPSGQIIAGDGKGSVPRFFCVPIYSGDMLAWAVQTWPN